VKKPFGAAALRLGAKAYKSFRKICFIIQVDGNKKAATFQLRLFIIYSLTN